MRKINILLCIEYLAYGGTEKQVCALIEGLNKERFQPHLCCLKDTIIGKYRRAEAIKLFHEIECPKIQLDFISFNKIRSFLEILRLISYIKTHQIDIIQAYSQDSTVLSVAVAKLFNVNHVVTCFRDMGFSLNKDSYLKMNIFYKLCNNYLANSYAVRDFYIKYYGLSMKKSEVIYNGIVYDKFSDLENIRRKCKNKSMNVGIVANFNRRVKRVDVFIKAAAYVLERIDGIKFVIAGDGELRKELTDLTFNLGISSSVEFLGRVHNVPDLLKFIDIGVISSDSEGFSNSILEYMAAGIPVIATDVGGNREIIKDGFNGFLVPAGDHESLGQCITELIKRNDQYDKISENALNLMKSNYRMEDNINNYERFYEKIFFERHKNWLD